MDISTAVTRTLPGGAARRPAASQSAALLDLEFVCVSVERRGGSFLPCADGKRRRRRRNTPHFSGEISLPLFRCARSQMKAKMGAGGGR